MFIYVALGGPRCPHTQQCIEKATAGYNTSHISCLSHMAVLVWPGFLPHLPFHLNPQSLFFRPVSSCLSDHILLPHHPQSQVFYHVLPSPSSSCAHNKSTLLCSMWVHAVTLQPHKPPPSQITALLLPSLAQGHIWNGEWLPPHPTPPFHPPTDGLWILIPSL